MSNQTFDVDRFKRDSRSSWDHAAAGWEKWWPLFERCAQSVSNRLVELARIKPGARVLDIEDDVHSDDRHECETKYVEPASAMGK